MFSELDGYLGLFDAALTTTPGQSGLVRKPVLELQRILNALGWSTTSVKPDGGYGPATTKAWAQSATKRGLNPGCDRAGPDAAWVHPQTHARL